MYYSGSGSIDWVYLIILVALFILSAAVSSAVNNRYKKYSNVFARSGITGAQAAEKIMLANGVTSASIQQKSGRDLSDYYDPKTDSLHLSANTYNSCSVSAIGVACHEAGHAIQYAKNYGPVKIRMAIIPFCSVCSKAAIPLILIGFIFSAFSRVLGFIALIGIIFYALAVLFQLITLPVEFDASRRAMANIRSCGILTDDECAGAKSILTAAAMTYVVATLSSVVQLLRLISIFNNRRN